MAVTITKVEQIYKGWSTLSKVTLSDGTHSFSREVGDHGNAVAVLPYDHDRRVALLVQLPRTPVLMAGESNHLLEAPAGLIDEGEDRETCARREAQEETGVSLGGLELVSTIWSCVGVLTERITLFLASYSAADRTGSGGGLAEEHENITVVEMPLADLARLADSGDLTDMKTFALLQTLRLRRPELF